MQLTLFTGLPSPGKSSVAEALARELAVPVFAKDWLEAPLVRCGAARSAGDAGARASRRGSLAA